MAGNTPPRSVQHPVSVLEGRSCDINSPVLLAAPCTTPAASRAGDTSGRDVRNRCWNHLWGRPRARGQAPTGFATACLSHNARLTTFCTLLRSHVKQTKAMHRKGTGKKHTRLLAVGVSERQHRLWGFFFSVCCVYFSVLSIFFTMKFYEFNNE